MSITMSKVNKQEGINSIHSFPHQLLSAQFGDTKGLEVVRYLHIVHLDIPRGLRDRSNVAILYSLKYKTLVQGQP